MLIPEGLLPFWHSSTAIAASFHPSAGVLMDKPMSLRYCLSVFKVGGGRPSTKSVYVKDARDEIIEKKCVSSVGHRRI